MYPNNFIFIDDEEDRFLIKWDKDIFEREYIKLQNEYWDKEDKNEDVDYSVFYNVLQERLEKWDVIIYRYPLVVYHKYLDFNKYKNEE